MDMTRNSTQPKYHISTVTSPEYSHYFAKFYFMDQPTCMYTGCPSDFQDNIHLNKNWGVFEGFTEEVMDTNVKSENVDALNHRR
jgi:hypothetical protein